MNVFAVVVAYHPKAGDLTRLCGTLSRSGARVVVVDNTEDGGGESQTALDYGTRIVLGENRGIARAQNAGITAALTQGADVIVLFDQDSEPEELHLGKLVAALTLGVPGVVVPVCKDRASGAEMPSYRLNWFGVARKVFSLGQQAPYRVDLAIASGTAATAVTFSLAGKMDEDFFIDFVDFEWCLRCRGRQIPVRVVPDVVMRHTIGERTIALGPLRGSVHGVNRSYYKIRNCFLLFRKPGIPLTYATWTTISALIRYALLLPFMKTPLAYLRVYLTAIRHGLTGIVGKNPAI